MNLLFSSVITTIIVGAMGFTFHGATAPAGLFDPFRFTETSDSNVVKRYREAELKHGRWAMLSALSMPIIESKTGVPAIHEFDNLSSNMQILIVLSVMAGEITVMKKGWKNPFVPNENNYFKLLDNYQPGDLGFGLSDVGDVTIYDKELNNGRLAMIGSIGMIVQELVTGKPLFEMSGM